MIAFLRLIVARLFMIQLA